MPDALKNRLTELRRHVRRLLWVNGLAWLVAVLIGSMAVVGTADWLFRFSDAGVRLILSLSIITAASYVAYRWLIKPLLVRLNDLDLALRIEQLHPELKDSLASTVQFLEGSKNPAVGSPALQQQVIDETIYRLDNIEFDQVVQSAPVRKIVFAATVVTLITACLVGWNRAEAGIALKRMVLPFSDINWPKQTELRLLDSDLKTPLTPDKPLRIAIGETLGIHAENLRGPLPADGLVHFRFPNEQLSTQKLSPITLKDNSGEEREVYATSLMIVEGPIQFRVEAGDDRDMPWHTIEAIIPPNLEELQVTLSPPEYTRQAPVQLPAGSGHVEGLLGTRVFLSARADKPLADASLHLAQEPQPLQIQSDGVSFTAEFEITQEGEQSYWLSFRDREAQDEGESRHYDLRGMIDAVPAVEITLPANNIRVTPEALVPIQINAKDDWGLNEIRLAHHLTRSAAEAESENEPPQTILLFTAETRPQNQTVEYELNMADYKLQSGDQLTMQAEATDAYDLGPAHVGQSMPRVLTIVSAEDKKQELADRQADIMSDLEAARQQQQIAQQQIRELKIQLAETEELRPQDVDTLQRAEMTQRRTAKKLTDEDSGVASRAQQLLKEIRDNKLEDDETTRRMEKLDAEINQLKKNRLPRIEEELTNIRKRAGADLETAPSEKKPDDRQAAEQQESLAKVEKDQQIVLESLDETLKEMARWRNHRDLARELDDLIASQEELNKESNELSRRTLTKSAMELTAQEKSDLKRAGEKQQQIAKRLDQLQSKVREAIESSSETVESERDILENVADQLNEQSTSSRMRETAEQLQKNDVGAAGANQQELLEELKGLHDTFRNRQQDDKATLIKKIRNAEEEVTKLRKKQQDLMQKLKKAQETQDPQKRQEEMQKLQKEQQQLKEETEKLTRRLRRLQLKRGRDAAARAAQRQQQAQEKLQQDDPIAAEEQIREAEADLEQAERELARERRALEEQLAREQLEKIADELKAMIPRQQAVVDETIRLNDIHKERGSWTRGTLRTLRDLTATQEILHAETQKLIETLTAAEVFALALRGAARDMERAATRLGERQTDEQTQRHETRAKQRFVDLVAALEKDPPGMQNNQEQQQQQQQNPDGDQGGPQTDGIPQIAQLKMLRTLQEDLKERTTELAQRLDGVEELDPAQKQELNDLALEQTNLADLMRNLTKITAQPAEEKPAPQDDDANDDQNEGGALQ